MRYMLRVLIISFIGIGCLNGYLDNRFLFPLNYRFSWRTREKPSLLRSSVFFMTADESRSEHGDDIRLPDLGGTFDLSKLNKAMKMVGIDNPYYLSEWDSSELPYVSYGKMRATGFDVALEYALTNNFSIGGAFSLMHVHARGDYCISDKARSELSICNGNETYTGGENALEQARLNANKLLNINSGQWSVTGLSDVELYMRMGLISDYWWKFKQVDASLWIGGILPTGEKRAINSPLSVPLGGDGHYGIFLRGELALEVTDDVFFGLWLYGSKRFAKTQTCRMPMACEALGYGVLVANAQVTPGFLVGVSPYLIWDDIQDGFGAYAGYTLVHHMNDSWKCLATSYQPNIGPLRANSKWTNEFFTIGLDYDFTKTPKIREYGPRFFFDWTVPVRIFAAKNVYKTHRISLGIEFHF